MEIDAREGIGYRGKCYICHSGCYEDAREVAAMVKERFSNIKDSMEKSFCTRFHTRWQKDNFTSHIKNTAIAQKR